MYVYEGTPHAKRVLAVPAHLAPALERWLMEDPDVGVLKMRLLWPLDPAAIRQVLPDTAEQLEVLEVGAPGDRPFLYPALASALADSGLRAVPRYLARAEARSDQRGPLSRREGTETVSYTHLDVYKRQDLHRPTPGGYRAVRRHPRRGRARPPAGVPLRSG